MKKVLGESPSWTSVEVFTMRRVRVIKDAEFLQWYASSLDLLKYIITEGYIYGFCTR